MKQKLLSEVMLTILMLCILSFGYKIEPAKSTWTGTVYIRADGSIAPPDAPMITYDNITYTLTDNIVSDRDGIVIERDEIVIDGAGYLVDGPRAPPYTGFPYKGINLNGRSNVTIKNVNIQEFCYGIWLYNSSKIRIYKNNFTNNYLGIHLESSSNNSITENNVRDASILRSCFNNIISGNDLINADIMLDDSSNNNLTANMFNSSYIVLSDSNSNFICGNKFYNGGFSYIFDSYDNVVMDNFVNDRPLVYLEKVSDFEVYNAGQVILINCTRIRIEDLNLSRTAIGIWLEGTTNTRISRNIIEGSRYGIWLVNSSYNTIEANNVRLNGETGIFLSDSSNCNTISENAIANNGDGISLVRSINNTVLGNIITANAEGILLGESHNNIISENNVTANAGTGIHLTGGLGKKSSNNIISKNNIMNNGIGIELSPGFNNSIIGNTFINDGLVLELESYGNFVEGNLVNGEPLVYFEGTSDINIKEAGQVILINCNNVTIENLNLSKTDIGIQLWETSNITIRGNNITANNMGGISIYSSSFIKISRNNIMGNNGDGIWLYGSNNTIIENIITANNEDGINIGGSYNIVSRNIITNNGKEGILFWGSYSLLSINKIVANIDNGIWLYYGSSYNSILGNNMTNNVRGIFLHFSSNNSVLKNTIANNNEGIRIQASNNSIYQNNFINNLQQVCVYPYSGCGWVNQWDNGYSSGGNYWSNYNGVDLYSGPYQNEPGSDGIGDASYVIDVDNTDRYPLMAPFNSFNAGVWNGTTYYIDIVSNSTVSNFQINAIEETVSFNVSGVDGTSGFCRLTLPHIIVQELWNGNFSVLYDGRRTEFRKWENSENMYIYFSYWHSEHKITILQTSNRTLQITTTPGGTTNPLPANYTYTVGEQVNVTALPNIDFSFDHWELDGVNVGSENPISILMDSNHTLHAVFIKVYNLTITTTPGGTTDPPPSTYTYVNGTEVSVTALPNTGYSFDYWLLDGEVRTENPITITMDKNYTLEAYFIDDIPPELSDPWQDPPPENVQPFQNVTVWVNVTDYGTGIKNVTLLYSLNNGTSWEEPINMTALPIPSGITVTYEAVIPGYQNCTWVTYKIIAYDNAGNNATKDNNDYYYTYHVVPEFPSNIALLVFLMLITIPLIFAKRRRLKKANT